MKPRIILAKFRVYKWAMLHPEVLTLTHILEDASTWLRAEKGALVKRNGKTIWRDHREVRPDWAKEFIPDKIWKELIILAEE